MKILGLNLFHADSSAVLLDDGKIIAAAEEERFTRIKHYTGFPTNSINFCLKKNNLNPPDIDAVTVNFNTNYNFSQKLMFSLVNIKNYTSIFTRFRFLQDKSNLKKLLYKNLGYTFDCEYHYVPHHISHIASSYLYSGMDEALGLSFDASGDFSTLEFYILKKNKIKLINKKIFPYSLGIFYQAMTQYLGFLDYGDEYKVMGMSAYGKNEYAEEFNKIVWYDKKNIFGMDLDYFNPGNFFENLSSAVKPNFNFLFSKKLEELLGPRRIPNTEISKKYLDIAKSMQLAFETIVINNLKEFKKEYNLNNLCIAGGCALNASCNGKILKELNFDKVFIQPNSGDAGGALGSAGYIASQLDKNFINKKLNNLYLGDEYDNDQIKNELEKNNLFKKNTFDINFFENFEDIAQTVANDLSNGKVVAWHQDRFEFGPRALGNRSILADARNPNIKSILNNVIKNREEFRPFAPVVLKEFLNEYFEINNQSVDYSFMNYVCSIKENHKNKIPGAIHFDNTCRIQSLSESSNKKFHMLLSKFYEKTKVPILINTSLNIQEPICNTPYDTINCFLKSKMNVLVMNNWVVRRVDN